MTVYWHAQGNSQETNAGGTSFANSYIKLYEATPGVPVTLINHCAGDTRWPQWKAQQSTVLASLVPGSLNVLSLRPSQILDADFTSIYGGSVDSWAADVISVLQTYLAAGMRICLVTSILGSNPSRRHLMDDYVASWRGIYCHGVGDMRSDPIMSDDAGWFAAHPNEFQSDGHLKDPGSALVYSYFKPAMDDVVRPSFFSRA